MQDQDKHESVPLFEHLRASNGLPAPAAGRIDVALLEAGAESSPACAAMAAAVQTAATELELELGLSGTSIRLVSFDVAGRGEVPEPGRFRLHLGAGEPAERRLAPDAFSEGTPLADLLDAILGDANAAMLATGETFEPVCRWAGIAAPSRRSETGRGTPLDRLSREAMLHPWFVQFAHELPDHQHFHVVDDRISDVILEDAGKTVPIAFEAAGATALTMLEIARSEDGVMPRFLAMSHHPQLAAGMNDRQLRLTAYYTLLEPLRYHLRRVIQQSAQS